MLRDVFQLHLMSSLLSCWSTVSVILSYCSPATSQLLEMILLINVWLLKHASLMAGLQELVEDEFPRRPGWFPLPAFLNMCQISESPAFCPASPNPYELRFAQQRIKWKMVVKKWVVPELSCCTLSTHSSPHCVFLTYLLLFALKGATCSYWMMYNSGHIGNRCEIISKVNPSQMNSA